MKVKMGQIISEARGKIAGMVFSRNSSGAYARQKVSPVNVNSVAQQAVRTLMTTLAQAWRGLTVGERALWNTVSNQFTNIDVFGDNVPLTGFGLYTRLNRNLQTINETVITSPPAVGAVTGIDTISVVIDNAEITTDEKIEITYTPVIAATHKVILYATPPLSAGKSFVKSEYRIIDIMEFGDVTPFDVGDAYVVVFGAIPAAGSKAFFKMKPVVIATGQDGNAHTADAIAV